MENWKLITAYEEGVLPEDETLLLFQDLIDTGDAWILQDHYGREARRLLQEGRISWK